jgi:hypothetical protein
MAMKSTYSPDEFGALIGKTTKLCSVGIEWAQSVSFFAQRRYYTHNQYLQITGQKAKKQRLVVYCSGIKASQKNDLSSQKNAMESFVSQIAYGD